jgi:thiol-disulfide isomerase/thioredoxin
MTVPCQTSITTRSRVAATIVLLAAVLLPPTSVWAQTTRGIAGRQAPAWDVTQWINLPDGAIALNPSDFQGKVVYLYCFQSWCPGCHSRGFPTLQALIEHYQDNDDVAFVAVQTTFEGFSTNSPEAAWKTADRYDLKIPVGHSGGQDQRSKLMTRYRNGGTPWVVIIDKEGKVQFNDFHISMPKAVRMIDALESVPDNVGQHLVGTQLPDLKFERQIEAEDQGDPAKPKLTLYRWWTDGCRYCQQSLPAINTLRTKYATRGLQVVGVYHPKPPRPISDQDVRRAARDAGFKGKLAIDENWIQLNLAFDPATRQATSISLLVDQDGTIRFVHPGPVLFASDDPAHAQANNGYQQLESAIKAMLDD